MKTHDEIRRLLPAYCGNDLDPEEKELVEEHLRSCAECRAGLADLELAMRLIHSTPQVDPPPWMTARIMARVLEHAPERRSWLQRIFFPLHVKVPLQVVALLVVCVSSYYLSRTVETDLGQQPQPGQVHIAPESAPAVAPPGEPAGMKRQTPPARDKALPPQPEAVTARPAPPSAGQPEEHPPFPAPRPVRPAAEETAPGGAIHPKPAMTPEYSEARQAPPVRSHERIPGADSAMRMKAGRGLESRESVATRVVQPLRLSLRLDPDDPASASETVPLAVIRSGGTLVQDGYTPPPRRLKTCVPSGRLPELIERLERLGRIGGHPTLPSQEGMVEVDIIW